MKVNRLILTLFIISFCIVVGIPSAYAQETDVTANNFGRGSLTTLGGYLRLKSQDVNTDEMSIEMRKKKYLTFTYELVTVDDSDIKAHLRYNILDDEMEFVRENNLYYLVKDIGRKVVFENTKATYKILRFNEKLQYFKVLSEGNYTLLAKHRVRYIESRPAESGYDKDKPAKYKRQKDELYLALDQIVLAKLTGIKKSKFMSFFGSRSKEMSTFIKKNKLSYKKTDDIKKIIGYYNSL